MPLPTGTWTINLNGRVLQLIVSAVDALGNMSGSLAIAAVNTPVSGFWDEVAQKLSFSLAVNPQSFTGFLFQDQFRMPGLTGSTVFTLVGSFQDFTVTSGDRLVFGWYAQIGAT